jgi:hypothetical protein
VSSLFVVPLDRLPEYEALSYTWGDSSDLCDIFLDGHRVEVRYYLEIALRQLRNRATPRILWIDTICIDQINEEELGEQVAKMQIIYSNASKVLVWLGRGYNGSDLDFSLLHNLHEDSTMKHQLKKYLSHQKELNISSGSIGGACGLSRKFISPEASAYNSTLWNFHNGLERHVRRPLCPEKEVC